MSYRNSSSLERRSHWMEWFNVVLAMWLFLSPSILKFGVAGNAPQMAVTAAWNAWIFGAAVFIVSSASLSSGERWWEWFNVTLGAWIFLAPWILGFGYGQYQNAAWDHWLTGAAIAFFGGWFAPSGSSNTTQNPPPTAQP